MQTGVQFTGSLQANASQVYSSGGWAAASYVVWSMVPTTPKPGSMQLSWEVSVGRTDPTNCTYWITVKNLSSVPITFEGRYAVLS